MDILGMGNDSGTVDYGETVNKDCSAPVLVRPPGERIRQVIISMIAWINPAIFKKNLEEITIPYAKGVAIQAELLRK
jgi:hypothetical protein